MSEVVKVVKTEHFVKLFRSETEREKGIAEAEAAIKLFPNARVARIDRHPKDSLGYKVTLHVEVGIYEWVQSIDTHDGEPIFQA